MNSLYLENSIINSLFVSFPNIFYSDTANAIPADLAGHSPAGLAVVSIPSFSSPEFLVLGDASLLEQLLPGASERNGDEPVSPPANGGIGVQLDFHSFTE